MRMKRIVLLLLGIIVSSAIAMASESGPEITPEQAMKILQEGNARFVEGKSEHPRIDAERLKETGEKGQFPIVTILGCSDSRVPPEVIFDQGVGDIFAVRVAGNVADTDEIGTIEYGVEHLRTPILIVMGHSKCGAVTAVVKGAKTEGSIPSLVDNIVPPVTATKKLMPNASEAYVIKSSICANVWQSINDIFRRSRIVRELVEEGKLKVYGAVYDIESGKVEWLDEAKLPVEPKAHKSGTSHKKPVKQKKH